VFQVGNAEERRRIAHLVRHKIRQTSAEDWDPADRREIRRVFGITLLPSPGPVTER
jgi:hypothetical protein